MIRHEVLTPEKVPFSYRVAGLGSRFLAWLCDLVLLVVLILAGALAGVVLEVGRHGLGVAVIGLWSFVVLWSYFLLFEWLWLGQTPGKRLLGIRVIESRGTAVSFYQAAVRNLLRVIDSLPIPVPLGVGAFGFVTALANREQRRLGDLAADTLVVHVERRAAPVRAVQEAGAALERSRVALLRQRLSQLEREQKQTLLDLCLRRDQLRVVERTRLFQAASRFVQARLDLAPETYESDEKFILQLGAALASKEG